MFNAYFEPFLGSGAVFFDLHARGLLAGRPSTLTDDNPDLIACYRAVRDCPDQVMSELSRLAEGHDRDGARFYYEVRNDRFNPQRATLSASAGGYAYSPALAAMFLYLNRTGYNGLFRLNSNGEFNVPAGRYARPRICDEANLRRVSAALARASVTLEHARFERAAENARPGDFLYFDPPYAPVSRTARFTSYTSEGFGADDQQRLRDVTVMLARRGCHVLISNSTAPDIARLYENSADVQAAGLRCHRIPARRSINSNGGRRGVVDEYLITNVPER